MHLEKQAQIRDLLFDKSSTSILIKYSNYSNIFSIENIVELQKHNKINDHAIKLKESNQLLFGCIYSLKLVELEILKTYIQINLTNKFI